MARSLLVAALLLLAVGCKRSSAPESQAESAVGSSESAVGSSESAVGSSALTCRTLPSCTDSCADAACAEACARRLTASARPTYDALQACVVPACANADAGAAPCRAPGSFACKMCVLSRCATQAAACMSH